jgi:hypothetical protein
LFSRIVGICAAAIEEQQVRQDLGVPPLPKMVPIRAGFLVAGDYVWRSNWAFEVIETVGRVYDVGHADEVVHVHWASGSDFSMLANDLVRVPVSRSEAAAWNADRVTFDGTMLHSLESTYGRSGV